MNNRECLITKIIAATDEEIKELMMLIKEYEIEQKESCEET